MFKRIALLLLILLLPLFCVAGFYAYVWWTAKQTADELATALSPYAEFSYDAIHIDLLNTEVGLREIRLMPFAVSDQVLIDEWVLKTADWSQMLSLASDFEQGNLPTGFSVRQRGLLLDLNGAGFKQFMAMAQSMPGESLQFSEGLCGPSGDPDRMALGYQTLSHDMVFNYHFDRASGQMQLELDSDVAQVATTSLDIKLQVQGGEPAMGSVMTGAVALSALRISYQDKGYNRRYRNFCRAQAGLSDEQLEQRFRAELDVLLGQLSLGLMPSQKEAVAALYQPGALVALTLLPDIPLGPAFMPAVDSPEALLSVLNPAVYVNDKMISLEGIQWDLPVPRQTGASVRSAAARKKPAVSVPAAEAVAPDAGAEWVPTESVVAKPAPEFYPAAVTDAVYFIGSRARMVTYFGRQVEGYIRSVSASQLVIEQRMGNGMATYAIDLDKIAEFEVYE
ncbi:MAG: hypothetical protein ACPGF7_01585 [Pontibacterium sp.]